MKIACDACDAKYSIADDKVRGKVFKIRCKKCSNVIVVRGVADDVPPPEPTPPVAPDAIWHFVVDGDQVGPLALDAVREKLTAGQLDGESYAWCEGQADWQALSQVPELAALLAPETLPESPAVDVLASVSARDNVQRMKAERNESSVLFSLSNLSQIATRGNSPQPSSTTASSTPGQEGSGLIDIRSMASAYLGTPGVTVKQAPGSIDDLPVFATATTFSEPAVLVPLAAPASTKKMLYVVIAAASAFAAIALVLLVLVLKKSDAPAAPPPVVAEPPTPPVAKAEPPPQPSPPPVVATAEPPKPEVKPDPKPPEPKHEPKVDRPKHVDVPKQLQPAAVKEDKCDEVHCLVDSSAPCCQKKPTQAAAPDALNKQMIQQAMSAIKARVLACGTTAHGRAHVKIHVSPNGRVDEASVDQSVSAGVDACIEHVVKTASFPATKNGGGFGVPYDL
ncbi:MAG: GYF domain-containing protein [Kofleriaceae bacterium]